MCRKMNSVALAIAFFLVHCSEDCRVWAHIDGGYGSQIGYLYGSGGGGYAPQYQSLNLVGGGPPSIATATAVAAPENQVQLAPYYQPQSGYDHGYNCGCGYCNNGLVGVPVQTGKKNQLLNKLLLRKSQKLAHKNDGQLIQQQLLVRPYCQSGGYY